MTVAAGRKAPSTLTGRRHAGAGLIPAALLVLALASLIAAQPTHDQWELIAPMLAMLAVASVLVRVMYARRGVMPLDDIAVWHVGVVMLYGMTPLCISLALGGTYTPLNDLRLVSNEPTAEMLGRIAWFHVAYIAATTFAYLVVTHGLRSPLAAKPRVPIRMMVAAATIWVCCELFLAGLGFAFHLTASDYSDTYLVIQQLPLAVRQAYRLAGGIRVIESMFVMTWMFADYRKRWWMLALWIAGVTAETLISGGARTPIMILMGGSFMLYHRLVRPVRLWVAVLAALVIVGGFSVIGLVRQARTAVETGVIDATASGEFEHLFANSVDLQQRRDQREYDILSPQLYLSEIFSAVPSQLLPFKKIDLAGWYISTFYPENSAHGEGFAFGVIAQGIVGFGWIEIVVRGMIVGLIFGAITRWYVRRPGQPFVLVAYLWFTVLSYNAFRNTTFSVFATFAQQFLPSVLLLWITMQLLATLRRTEPARGAG